MDALTVAAGAGAIFEAIGTRLLHAPATSQSRPIPRTMPATSLAALRAIVRHPAFRLGVLDAQSGAPFDTGDLLSRLGADPQLTTRTTGDAQLAQTRYEEGRIAVLEHGLSCKHWNDPARLPASVRNFVAHLAPSYGNAKLHRRQDAIATDRARPAVWPTLPL